MVEPRYQDISMGMDPSIFREKIAMIAGSAAKGPMSRERTKELTNQNLSASLPVAAITTGAVPFFSLQSVFFMADLLYRMSWAAQNHFMHRLLWYIRKGHARRGEMEEQGKSQDNFFHIKTDTCRS
jgi:hypothetical protein